MPYFPQLESGAIAQYPFVKRRSFRTVVNTLPGGYAIKLLDPGATLAAWELNLGSLTNTERVRIEDFFRAMEGKLYSFTLLDPTENLLLWSDELTSPVWTANPQLSVTGGIEDPEGGARAWRLSNSGPANQAITQSLEAPGWYRYSFSVYAKSETIRRLTLFRSSSVHEHTLEFAITPQWTRLSLSGASPSNTDGIAFGIRIDAGSSVDVYGPQAEAQPAPSLYRKTTSWNGVYTEARFDNDVLEVVSDGPEQHACAARIVARIAD
jgi:hypothetical protein